MQDIWSLLPYGTRQITTIKVAFGNAGRLPVAFVTRTGTQIRGQSRIASPFFLPRPPNFPCTFLQMHLHPLMANPFGIIEIFQMEPGLESLQNICICSLPVQGSIT
jgi:hypothetical protein